MPARLLRERHRRSTFCREILDTSTIPFQLVCAGPTMTAVGDPDRNFGNDVLPETDINTLNLMYAMPLGDDEHGDTFGSSVAPPATRPPCRR